ncbi:hypothetical protein SAMN02745126_03700 [Enhydrobacter aerosaccus]|uniref:Secreted protein n=2 Tax=Enhydrobacter aerosaccus TaxID=225324 RepID=A0A1T4RAC2_9HYPH|nr:hypothetical protein SAMN02745126_03700 [Enhydrobacter aerosaccus]
MSRHITSAACAVSVLFAVAITADAVAQTGSAPVTAIPSATVTGPEFRDPKTGQVWTPENVGKDDKPLSPQDRAFNPSGQTVNPGQTVDELPQIRQVGTVPVTAGATVPLVTLDNVSLNVQPGGRWQAVLYLQNNSANGLSPVIGCGFTNGGNLVQNTRISLPIVAAGTRVGIVVSGPGSEVFVDSVSCNIVSP